MSDNWGEKFFDTLKKNKPATEANSRVVPSYIPMHPMAYGLNIEQREEIVRLAKGNLYYEAWIAGRFNISRVAVRDICKKMGGYVCKKIEDGKHIDGYEI